MERIRIIIELHSIIICFVASMIMMIKKSKHEKAEIILENVLIFIIFLLLADIADITFSGDMSSMGRMFVPIANFATYAIKQFLIIEMGIYVCTMIDDIEVNADKKWMRIIYILTGVNLAAIFINIFNGMYYYIDANNVYQRGPLFLACILLSLCGMVLEVYKILEYRDEFNVGEIISMESFFVIPTIGLALQIILPSMCFFNIGVTIAVILVIAIYEYEDYLLTKEKDESLAKSRAYLLNSQIKPHFLFNSLSVIQSLIEDEPEIAQKAIGHLSKYLRKNLDLELSEKPISVWDELEFTENYLYMEKLRFGDKINIRYDLEEDLMFDVPFLSVQTIVENAIRHGIRKKMEGGTVLIQVTKDEKNYLVRVKDNGVGFDPSQKKDRKPDENSNGVGMKNVEERLQLLSKGKLEIVSAPGHGTTVTIIIPKE